MFSREVVGCSAVIALATGVVLVPQDAAARSSAQERHAAASAVWTQLVDQPWQGLAELELRATSVDVAAVEFHAAEAKALAKR